MGGDGGGRPGGGWRGGGGPSGGTPAKVDLGGLDFTAGAEVTASLLARLGDGRTWVVGSEAEAQAVIAAGGLDRPADVTYNDRAWLSALGVAIGTEAFDGGAAATAGAAEGASEQHWGASTDHRTGHRTTSIHASWAAQGSVLGDLL